MISCRRVLGSKGRLIFAAASVLLGVAIIAQVLGNRQQPSRPWPELWTLVPIGSEAQGWNVSFQPLSETPEGIRHVEEILKFDDAVVAEFTHGNVRISAYIAYWRPGKMPYRLVASHTPDVCWIGVGWHCVDCKVAGALRLSTGVRLKPAQQRVMTYNGHTEIVLFWHIVGNRLVTNADGSPPWYAFAQDLLTHGRDLRGEQMFVRLSSNMPLDAWWGAPPLDVLLGRLPSLTERSEKKGTDVK